MDRAIRRRLDVLIVRTSVALGILFTVMYFSERIGVFVIGVSVVVAVPIGILAVLYVSR